MNFIDLRFVTDVREIDLDTVDLSVPAPDFEPNRQYYFMAKARSYVRELSEKAGRPLTFFTQTFGCQMNTEHEIEKAA